MFQNRQPGIRGQCRRLKPVILSKFIGGFAFKTAITVMAVVKRLKAFTLPLQMCIAAETVEKGLNL
jgi:hypothetical protein